MSSVKIQIHGKIVRAVPISRRPDGSWLMRVLEKTGRLTPNTRVAVSEGQVIEGMLPAVKALEPPSQSEEE